jgi:hypothetical protein
LSLRRSDARRGADVFSWPSGFLNIGTKSYFPRYRTYLVTDNDFQYNEQLFLSTSSILPSPPLYLLGCFRSVGRLQLCPKITSPRRAKPVKKLFCCHTTITLYYL